MNNKKNAQDKKPETLFEQQLSQLPETYPQLAMRTNKPGKDIKMTDDLWKGLLTAYPLIMEGCTKADRLKASLVYGTKFKDFAYSAMPACPRKMLPSEIEMLHAIIGIISEGGELLEMFMKRTLAGKGIDRVNAREEAGDVAWFLQLLIRSFHGTMVEVQHMNIVKLQGRFGDKYSDLSGQIRDLEKERELLVATTLEQEKNSAK